MQNRIGERDEENKTPESGAPADYSNSLNASDPIPAMGGQTRDEIRLRNSGPISFDKIDDDLFGAILAGDETHVRARLGGSDKPLTEAEEIILIRTRQHEEEIGYERLLEQALAKAAKDDKDEPGHAWFFRDTAHVPHHAAQLESVDAYGGHYDRKQARYHDRFGGSYDATGYRFADGSYRTAAGDYYHAGTRHVQLAIGGQAEVLPAELADAGADILRLALQVAELRDRARDNPEAFAAPQAIAAALDTLDADARNRFEKLAMDDDFRRAASNNEGGALTFMSCPLLTRKDLRMAADIASDNLACGRKPHEIMQYHYKNILDMKDDAEDALAARMKTHFDHVQLPALSDKANEAFARFHPVEVGFSLKDKADSVFGKPETNVVPAAILTAQNRYRSALRRTTFAFA